MLNKANLSSKVNPDGSMDILVHDLYDFDYIDPENKSVQGKFYAQINNTAYSQQEKGQLNKYGLSIPIHLSKEEVESILQRRSNPNKYEKFLKNKNWGTRA